MEPLGRFLEYSMESLESILKAPFTIIPPRLFHRLSQYSGASVRCKSKGKVVASGQWWEWSE